MRKAREILIVIGSGVLIALGTLTMAPTLSKNLLFVAALPFVALIFIILVLNINTTFIFLLWTRSLMDPALERTKAGGNFGIGALVNVFVIIMVVLLVVRFPKVLQKNRYLLPWMAFLLMGLLTVVYAPVPVKAIRLMLSLTTYLCMFLAPFFIVKTEKDKKFWVRMLLYSSGFPVLFANIGLVVRKYPFMDDFARLEGTFTHPNILAFYLVLVVTVVLYVIKTNILSWSGMKKFFLWLYMADVLVLLVATQTRSAWFAAALLFLAYGLLKERKFLLVCLFAGLALLAMPQVQTRLKDLSQGTGVRTHEKLNSAAWRMKLWESAIPSIKSRPIFGYGLESFQALSGEFFVMEPNGVPAHNVYVELLFETGLVGVLAYLWIYMSILKTFFQRMIRFRSGPLSVESVILFSYVVGYIFVGVSDNMLHYLAFNWYFWFFVGVTLQPVSPLLQPKPRS